MSAQDLPKPAKAKQPKAGLSHEFLFGCLVVESMDITAGFSQQPATRKKSDAGRRNFIGAAGASPVPRQPTRGRCVAGQCNLAIARVVDHFARQLRELLLGR